MRIYSAAKVKERSSIGDFLDKPLVEVKARNYDEAIEKAIKKLQLKKGDWLSILALQGNMPDGIGRYTYKV